MSEVRTFGKRKIPKEELKFGFSLRSKLALNRYSESEVELSVVIGITEEADDKFAERVQGLLNEDSKVSQLGGIMLEGTIQPPNVRQQLVSIAVLDEVISIDTLSELHSADVNS